MTELLTRAIVEEYRKRAKALPDTAGQDIRERRELRIELQNRCGITELQAVNILNGFHADSYIVSEYRRRLKMHRRKLKTMKDWEREANGNCQYSWYDYAKPGDLVDESVFIYFMDVTTPRIYRDGYLQVGAPYSRVMDDEMGTERDTFPTFERVEKGIYRFCGNCFAGETKHIE